MSTDLAVIEAAAKAMYEEFRISYMGRFEMTPPWEKLNDTSKAEWTRHARIAAPIFLSATGHAA